MSFNHFDSNGQAIMVDISKKQPTLRTAIATSITRLTPAILNDIVSQKTVKGDVLALARIAAISSVKRVSDLIPLSHPLAIHHVSVEFKINAETAEITTEATVRAFERTGVEMEAMTSAAIAALTIYDMCKGSDKGISIGEVKLIFKEGGKSGTYIREVNA